MLLIVLNSKIYLEVTQLARLTPDCRPEPHSRRVEVRHTKVSLVIAAGQSPHSQG